MDEHYRANVRNQSQRTGIRLYRTFAHYIDYIKKRIVKTVKSHEKPFIQHHVPYSNPNVHVSGFQPPGSGYPYPIIQDPYSPPPIPGPQPPLFGGFGGSPSFNINQLKAIVDRMGGIDGILQTMTRVQKLMQTFQQMAPMVKLLLGTFKGGQATATSNSFEGDGLAPVRRKRRRRSRKRSSSSRKPSGSKVWSASGRRRT